MPYFKKWAWFIIVGCTLFPVTSQAQQKINRPGGIWPELQAEYVFKSTSYLFFRNHYRHNLDQELNYLTPDGPLQYLERAQIRAGYEHIFNAKWSVGISESYAIERTRSLLFNELYVRHINSLGKFRVTKRTSYEHIARWHQENIGRVRFRVDLDRDYKLSSKVLRPRVFYELFFNLDYTPQNTVNQLMRRVDRTRLRFELTYVANPHVAVTPYFMRQTDYSVVKSTVDATGTTVRSGGKVNHIIPIFGLDLRYTFFQGKAPFSRTIKSDKN